MCGLVGIAGNLLYQDEFTMKRLLLADFFRGEHSTGFAAIRSSGEAHIAKLASNPIDLFDTQKFKNALNGNASRVFMGHNRQATRGAVTTVNAHPYHYDHIIGAHNGTLDYESVRDIEKALDEKFSVDSMALIAAIARLGIKDTMALCNEGKDSKEGAWALVWYDQNEGSLNFLRNKHRPLWYAFEKGFKRMFYASEWWMIREAVESSTNGYKLYTEKEKGGKDNVGFFTFDENVHYKFDVASLCEGSSKRPKPTVKMLKGREKQEVGFTGNFQIQEWPRAVGPGTGGTHTGTVGNQNSQTKTEHSSKTTSSDKKRQVIQLVDGGDYAGLVSEEQFNLIYTKCTWCHSPVRFGDKGLTIIQRDGIAICGSCTGTNMDSASPPNRIYVRSSLFDTIK